MTDRPPDEDADRPKMPARRIPGELGWKLDAQGQETSVSVEPGFAFRLASIAPFLLVTLFGIVALIGWFVIILLGGGVRDPIWVYIGSDSLRHTLPQVALAVGLGLSVVAVTLLAMWAAMHGLDRSSGRMFWRGAQLVFSLLTLGLLLLSVARPEILRELGVSSRESLLAFVILGYALLMCRLRERRLGDEVDEDADE